ncbi:hypothetical protein, partial [Aeromonas rivipollensis]|uniref:hypothetical protein n=1 Tax=Aeromonas rivipollensis TaxID=948519 RepID=UPI001969E65F
NAVAPMVVWHSPCESRTLPGTQLEETPLNERGFLLPEIQRFSTDFLMDQRTLKPFASINGSLFSHLITFRPSDSLAHQP